MNNCRLSILQEFRTQEVPHAPFIDLKRLDKIKISPHHYDNSCIVGGENISLRGRLNTTFWKGKLSQMLFLENFLSSSLSEQKHSSIVCSNFEFFS